MFTNVVTVDTATSYAASDIVAKLVQVPGVEVRRARLNVSRTVPDDNVDSSEWPLIFECYNSSYCHGFYELRVRTLTCGYGGSGPKDLIRCIKAAGFDVDEDEIITNPRIVKKLSK